MGVGGWNRAKSWGRKVIKGWSVGSIYEGRRDRQLQLSSVEYQVRYWGITCVGIEKRRKSVSNLCVFKAGGHSLWLPNF